MTHTVITCYVVCETEKSFGVVAENADRRDAPILHLPKSKVIWKLELDELSREFTCRNAGKLEAVRRIGFPYNLAVDSDFLKKVGGL